MKIPLLDDQLTSARMMAGSILLSDEVIIQIFLFLRGREVALASITNKALFYQAIDTHGDFLWRCICHNELPRHTFGAFLDHPLSPDYTPEGVTCSWRKTFKHCYLTSTLSKMRWHQFRTSIPNHAPAARQGSNGASVKSKFYVYGGWTTLNPAVTNDLFRFTLDRETGGDASGRWKELSPSGDHPFPTYGHTMTAAFDKYLILFGGVTQGGYRGECRQFRIIQVEPDGATAEDEYLQWIAPLGDLRPHGDAPIARAYHTTNLIYAGTADNICQLIIFGGFNEAGAMGNLQLCTFNTNSKCISFDNVDALGVAPCPRFGHSATWMQNGSNLVVVGGCNASSNFKGMNDGMEFCDVHLLHLQSNDRTWIWSSPKVENQPPRSVAGRCHSAIGLDNKILVFGGGPPNFATNRLHVLTFQNTCDNTSDITCTWKLPSAVMGSRPPRRQNTVSAHINDLMLIFGGAEGKPYGQEELGDLFILQLSATTMPCGEDDTNAQTTDSEDDESDNYDHSNTGQPNPVLMSRLQMIFNLLYD